MKLYLFDLDRTLIHSDARVLPCYDAHGNLNIEKYRRTQTPEGGIYSDSILPLVKVYRRLKKQKNARVYCVTAREFNHHDLNYLELNDLKFDRIYERGTVSTKIRQNLGDGVYKADIIRPLLNLKQFSKENTCIFDDNKSVLNNCSLLGIKCFNAITLNNRLGFNSYLF